MTEQELEPKLSHSSTCTFKCWAILEKEAYILQMQKNRKTPINTEETGKVVKELSQESYMGEFFQAFME